MPTGKPQAAVTAAPSAGPMVMPARPQARTIVPADFWTKPLQQASAGGTATITLEAAPIGYANLIERISISTDSTEQTTADVYIGDATNLPASDHSPSANLDFSDYPRPLLVPGGEQLVIVFSSMSAGSTARVRIQGWTVAAANLPAIYMGGLS